MTDADTVRDALTGGHSGRTAAGLAALDRLEAENEHLRRYEDRGDFLVYRSEWETLFSPSTDLRERMEIMRQTLARLEAERDAAREKNRLLWTERGEILGRAQDAEAERDRLREALESVRSIQPRLLDWLRDNGIVFHRAPLSAPWESDGERWEQIAFSIYTDLCEMDNIAREALKEAP